MGLPGGVGAAGLTSFPPAPGCSWRAAEPGIWGRERPGEDLVGESEAVGLVGEEGLERREGRTGLGLPGTWTGLLGEGECGPLPLAWPPRWPFLKGLLETIFKEKSVFSGEANGGIGGLIFTLVGDSLGGRLGGFSS